MFKLLISLCTFIFYSEKANAQAVAIIKGILGLSEAELSLPNLNLIPPTDICILWIFVVPFALWFCMAEQGLTEKVLRVIFYFPFIIGIATGLYIFIIKPVFLYCSAGGIGGWIFLITITLVIIGAFYEAIKK